jgi:hypothetical protein
MLLWHEVCTTELNDACLRSIEKTKECNSLQTLNISVYIKLKLQISGYFLLI